MRTATTAALALRLALCQAAGTILGVLAGTALVVAIAGRDVLAPDSPYADTPTLIADALAISAALFPFVLALLHALRARVLRSPVAWCVVIPAALLLDALLVLPAPLWRSMAWLLLAPVGALCTGVLFLAWLRVAPLAAAER